MFDFEKHLSESVFDDIDQVLDLDDTLIIDVPDANMSTDALEKNCYKMVNNIQNKDDYKQIKELIINKPKAFLWNKGSLRIIIEKTLKYDSPHADLNWIDTSNVKDMSHIFENMTKPVYFDVSKWDTSNVINMSHIFMKSHFQGDISGWDVSNVRTFGYAFAYSKFKGDISKWNTGKATSMNNMFSHS